MNFSGVLKGQRGSSQDMGKNSRLDELMSPQSDLLNVSTNGSRVQLKSSEIQNQFAPGSSSLASRNMIISD